METVTEKEETMLEKLADIESRIQRIEELVNPLVSNLRTIAKMVNFIALKNDIRDIRLSMNQLKAGIRQIYPRFTC
ncbi:hypothetical protein DRQ36_09215 [bacterium]|nr:MAG: hypothetical protein DRQ36_09215 [bacterium]